MGSTGRGMGAAGREDNYRTMRCVSPSSRKQARGRGGRNQLSAAGGRDTDTVYRSIIVLPFRRTDLPLCLCHLQEAWWYLLPAALAKSVYSKRNLPCRHHERLISIMAT